MEKLQVKRAGHLWASYAANRYVSYVIPLASLYIASI